MSVIVATPEEIRAIINECLANQTPVSKPEVIKDEAERPIPQHEAEEFLGCSRQKLYRLRRTGVIKAHVLGQRVYYFKSELLEALKA